MTESGIGALPPTGASMEADHDGARAQSPIDGTCKPGSSLGSREGRHESVDRRRDVLHSGLTLLLLGVLGVNPGCATIIDGTSQTVHLETTPSGARINVMPGFHKVTSPADLELKRGNAPYIVTAELEGYESQRSYIRADLNGWTWANIVLGGVVGIVLDWATGSINDLEPDEIRMTLRKEAGE